MIAVLCGGIGGSRFLRALSSVVDPARISAIVNTGDDDVFHGLHVSPDPDIITYTLAGEVDEERGWGLRGDTFRWLESLRRFGHETWFNIGDRDLATHLHRTRLLQEGHTLSSITANIAASFGVRVTILPMSDHPVRTVIETADGDRSFQEFLVRDRAVPPVTGVRYEGAVEATPAPGVLEILTGAEAIFIAPSNPVGSIAPILAVPGIREAVRTSEVRRVALSPVIGGRSLQPPTAEMMAGIGLTVDVAGVARVYDGLIDALIVDPADAARADQLRALQVEPIVVPTLMAEPAIARALAEAALAGARIAG